MDDKTPLVTPDYWRQLDVFNPDRFSGDVHIIGVGAAGSWVAYILAKMGVRKLHAWDFDHVEAHNLPNQIFGRADVGQTKVQALAERLDRDCGCLVIPHFCAVGDPASAEGQAFLKDHPGVELVTPKLSGVVYLCPDKMSVRQFCWEQSVRYNLDVKLMIEIRLAAEFGCVHTVHPCYPQDIRGFEATLCKNEEAEESACTNRAIATTVAAVCSIAAHKLVKFVANEPMKPVVKVAETEEHSNYDLLCIRPIVTTTANWSK